MKTVPDINTSVVSLVSNFVSYIGGLSGLVKLGMICLKFEPRDINLSLFVLDSAIDLPSCLVRHQFVLDAVSLSDLNISLTFLHSMGPAPSTSPPSLYHTVCYCLAI